MKKGRLSSDQLYTWSDIYEESICHIITQKKKSPSPPAITRRGHPSRISDRTLQEMWKTRLPVCQRTGTRAQILSFDKPNREESSDGLYPPGLLRAGRSLPGELSINKEDPERNLRYQLRTSQPQREAVGNTYEFRHCYRHRHRRGRHVGCQYDHRTVKGSVAENFKYRGKA